MDDTMTDTTFTTADAAESLVSTYGKYMTEAWEYTAGGSGAAPEADELLREVDLLANGSVAKARTARQKAEATRRDDTLYPDGRERIARETIAGADENTRGRLDTAEILLAAAHQGYYREATPKVGKDEALTARADAQMMLSSAKDLGAVLARLASRQDSVGGLVNSPWLDDYLATRGMDDKTIEAYKVGIRQAALKAAASQQADIKRQRAAKRAIVTAPGGQVAKALTTARHAARNFLR